MDRRTFLKLAGMGSLAFAAACTAEREKRLYSLVQSPEDMESGTARWYASTCRECPAGCGVLVKNREGRAIKIEGNPLHPISRGTLCMRGQAALQAVYNPDRLKSPRIKENGKWRSIDYARAQQILNEKVGTAAAAGENRVRMITAIEGESLLNLFESTLSAVNAEKPLVYEPIAYENLKAANAVVFGERGLPAYRIDEADCLVGFGADFVETWLSPVEYARRFKAMHRYGNGRKNRFYHVAPSRSLTGANADAWLQCRPGGEAAVCLGLIRALLVQKDTTGLDKTQLQALTRIAEPYTPEKVKAVSGVSADRFSGLIRDLQRAEKPLVLGTDALANSGNDLAANIAVNLLNVLLDPSLSMLDFSNRHRIERAGGRQALLDFAARLDGEDADVLLLHNVNPLYDLPPGSPFEAALNRKNRFVVSFSNFMDDTAQAADMVFPVSLPLESWGEYGGRQELLSTLQPAMLPLFDAPHIGDVMLRLAGNKGKPAKNVKQHLIQQLESRWQVTDQRRWLETLRNGGRFEPARPGGRRKTYNIQPGFEKYFKDLDVPEGRQPAF
ncbi:MAG: molybdopterin-dependent oxidoreductase, partial [Thermodesulfobacteriota bacterium]